MAWLSDKGLTRRALVFGALALVAAQAPGARADEALQTLTLTTAKQSYEFKVEIAADGESRARGLMFRRFLPADRGMLFEFEATAPVGFWMKNTYIPLDMVFISEQGVVTHIAERAEPLSEAIIPSAGPCRAVLEINGGVAAKIGLAVGDRVRGAFFKP